MHLRMLGLHCQFVIAELGNHFHFGNSSYRREFINLFEALW